MIIGFFGGIFSALSGSGVDICSFSILCLLFRISEKVATPTSVVLMAINTCVGFYWRQLMMDGKNFLYIYYVLTILASSVFFVFFAFKHACFDIDVRPVNQKHAIRLL